MEKLFGDKSNDRTTAILYTVIPSHEIPCHMPAIEIDVIAWPEKRDLALYHSLILSVHIQFELRKHRKDFLLNHRQVLSIPVKDMKAVSPRELTFHSICGIPGFIIDIKTVKPGKQPLSYPVLHCLSSPQISAHHNSQYHGCLSTVFTVTDFFILHILHLHMKTILSEIQAKKQGPEGLLIIIYHHLPRTAHQAFCPVPCRYLCIDL